MLLVDSVYFLSHKLIFLSLLAIVEIWFKLPLVGAVVLHNHLWSFVSLFSEFSVIITYDERKVQQDEENSESALGYDQRPSWKSDKNYINIFANTTCSEDKYFVVEMEV